MGQIVPINRGRLVGTIAKINHGQPQTASPFLAADYAVGQPTVRSSLPPTTIFVHSFQIVIIAIHR
jgi:hypothetical protein